VLSMGVTRALVGAGRRRSAQAGMCPAWGSAADCVLCLFLFAFAHWDADPLWLPRNYWLLGSTPDGLVLCGSPLDSRLDAQWSV